MKGRGRGGWRKWKKDEWEQEKGGAGEEQSLDLGLI